ncbi:3-oxoacyl-[acyl-carrier-protein] synthase III C-terminal domain-containing protein [Streptomyces sp. NRRL S-1896]|uniref:3-oxoacyl-[acyl-carrier-protein] synthase III C-terminal domain-containing protein n=1 Tax=Streptomyces sp. NRRL S-1896 TaxID=1463893 RepID=UPI00099C2EB1|nr:3-oxoacyl-[acyl-carrier-protein] synthase III C-terminal domain-containing protein [Streptomyces sp. NRRL S-1896]
MGRTNAELAAPLGHFGGMDPLVSLDIMMERGELVPGDLVALAGMSSGLHWFCTLLEV